MLDQLGFVWVGRLAAVAIHSRTLCSLALVTALRYWNHLHQVLISSSSSRNTAFLSTTQGCGFWSYEENIEDLSPEIFWTSGNLARLKALTGELGELTICLLIYSTVSLHIVFSINSADLSPGVKLRRVWEGWNFVIGGSPIINAAWWRKCGRCGCKGILVMLVMSAKNVCAGCCSTFSKIRPANQFEYDFSCAQTEFM